MAAVSHIAMLGGGLTGLSSAWHLSKRFPGCLITVLEKESRFGGWVRSERVEVQDASGNRESMVLEAGPRTLRPKSKAVLELIHGLKLESSLITVPLTSPAAKSRFLHVPDTRGLAQLPSSLLSLFTSPLSPILLSAVLRESFLRSNRPIGATDESFDSFLTRRFGEEFARILGSALVHGVYAADSRKLSVRAAFPGMWEAEERGNGSIIKGYLRPDRNEAEHDDYALGKVGEMMNGVSVYSFKDGMSTLTDALLNDLRSRPNIRLLADTDVVSLLPDQATKTFKITAKSNINLTSTHVVSALPLPRLSSILSASSSLPHLTANPASSVTVANFVFPPSPTAIHPPGFGYLIPRPRSEYDIRHPGILGTVFDSCSTSAQDHILGSNSAKTGRFTKLTVMLGGPYPLSAEHTSVQTILQHISSHLSSRLPEPVLARVHRHIDCIPTLTVGHLDRMKELKEAIGVGPWEGKLEVVGAGVAGVSVADCVQAGRNVGKTWV